MNREEKRVGCIALAYDPIITFIKYFEKLHLMHFV